MRRYFQHAHEVRVLHPSSRHHLPPWLGYPRPCHSSEGWQVQVQQQTNFHGWAGGLRGSLDHPLF
jgi:hypothetical protein